MVVSTHRALNGLSAPAAAIEMLNLHKQYAASGKSTAKTALHDVSLSIPRGSMFALLGPNGAGKSTMINILAGLVRKTSGTARIWGLDIDTDRQRSKMAIGIVPQELNVDPFFTPREALDIQAGLYGVPRRQRRTMEILEAVGLADKADSYARALSGGMRRRLMVAKALVHQPPVLVLDEPTAGVDIELRQQLWRYVSSLNAQGTTVVLTTHYLEEAQELCDHIAIINKGTLIANERKDVLLQRIEGKALIVQFAETVTTIPESLKTFQSEIIAENTIKVQFSPKEHPVAQVLLAVQASGLDIADLSTQQADLEDVFLQLTRS